MSSTISCVLLFFKVESIAAIYGLVVHDRSHMIC